MTDNPIAVLATLLLAVAVADWLGRRRGFRHAGAAMLAILLGAGLANLGVLPVARDGVAVYDMLFALVTPAAIFLVLLEANLRVVRKAGPRMLAAFGVGAAGTVLGVLAALAWVPLPAADADLAPLAGMFAATYIGGSANFNAVALSHGMATKGTLFAVAVVVDNVMTMLWIVVTLLLPASLRRIGGLAPAVVATAPPTRESAQDEALGSLHRGDPPHAHRPAPEPGDPLRLDAIVPAAAPPEPLPDTLAFAVPLALAVTGVALSSALASMASARGWNVPAILILTTLALLLAQHPATARLTMAKPMGLWGMYLFLAAVGASADLGALAASGELGLAMFAFVAVILLVHGVVLIGFGLLGRIDPDVIAIASTANIGGATTAFALAESLGRKDLVLPGILAGIVGTALGTYVGLTLAGLL